jgi:hypothetical protein
MNQFSNFEEIYSTDLVYVPDCWKLCGDAHCCSFTRHKARFRMIAKTPFQELPLLPGEYEFLAAKGWLNQFNPHEHRVFEFPLDSGTLRVESIISKRPNCACDHDIRPTVCRLYPLLPVFDRSGRLTATEPLGIYEEMEAIEGLSPVCQVKSLPFEQFDKFLKIATELSRSPVHLFYLEAYRITKKHVAQRLSAKRAEYRCDIFAAFENAFVRRQLIDKNALRTELNGLAEEFKNRYGADFNLSNPVK